MKKKKFWNWINQAPEDNAPNERVLEIYGTIAEESWFDDDVTPKLFRDELFSGDGDVVIWLNSPGGDCIAASQIYSMLMDYKGSVTVKIDGLAASAASVIAMAGTQVLMAPTSMMMIHNPSTIAFGDHQDMQKVIEMLDEVKESIINAYEIKTDLSHTVLSHMMDETTWMNAKKAVELGFADGILEDAKKCTREEKSYCFAASSVGEAIKNKAVAKAKAEAKVKAETEAKVRAEAEEERQKAKAEEKVIVALVEEKPTGRSIEALMDRLNLIKY